MINYNFLNFYEVKNRLKRLSFIDGVTPRWIFQGKTSKVGSSPEFLTNVFVINSARETDIGIGRGLNLIPLKINECYISTTLAKAFQLNIGDSLELNLRLWDLLQAFDGGILFKNENKKNAKKSLQDRVKLKPKYQKYDNDDDNFNIGKFYNDIFDPETDFSIQPWIEKTYNKNIGDDDVIVGSNVNVPNSLKIKFYGQSYNIVAQLAKTGTGLDSAVYTNITTVKKMAETSDAATYNKELEGVDIEKSMSAIFIKVKDGYSSDDVAARINSLVKGVKAKSSASMVSNISSGLNGVSTVIGVLIGVVWFLACIILIITFVLISNERKKEFAILRTFGASRNMLAKIITSEAFILSGGSSLIGVVIGAIALIPLSSSLSNMFNLPFLMPSIPLIILFAVLTIVVTILVCFLSSLRSAYSISKDDAAILIREDA